MSTSAQNDRWLSKPWILIGIAVVIAVAGYFVGYSKGADAPRDQLAEQLRRTAEEKGADIALVVGKGNEVNAIHIASGKKVTPCDERSAGQEQCKFTVRKEADGKYVLIDSERNAVVPQSQILSTLIWYKHTGSSCDTGASGGHTTSNCCHSPPCY